MHAARSIRPTPTTSHTFLLFFLLFVLLACLPAFADADAADVGPGLHFRHDDGIASAHLVGTLVHLRVTGVVARASVSQIFRNPTDRAVEGIYVFPLPDGAAVDSMRMRLGDRVLESRIQTLEEARAAYRDAGATGRTASLLEVRGDDVFTARVTRLGAGENVEVEIGLQMVVGFDLDTFHLRFPLTLEPTPQPAPQPTPRTERHDAAPPFALRVDVAPGFEVASVASSTHEVLTRSEAELGVGGFSVELAAEVEDADRDFELSWQPRRGHLPRAVTFVETHGDERYALIMVIPPQDERVDDLRLPREIIFVLDTSGSMEEGGRLPQAVAALDVALGRLRSEDRFQVLRFSDETEAVFGASAPVSQRSLAAARRFVAGFVADGGTHATPALRRALTYPLSRHLRQVVLLTDGKVNDEQAALRVIEEQLGTTRLFPIAIGHAPNRYFVERVAALGRGTTSFVTTDAEVRTRMDAFLRKLENPVLQDIEVSWDAFGVDARPAPVPDLYSGEPLVLAARIGDATEVTLRGRLRDRDLELTLPLPLSPAEQAEPAAGQKGELGLHREWARRQVDHLLAEIHRERIGATTLDLEEAAEEVTDLGLRHGVVTPYTSLVAVDPFPSADAAPPPPRPVTGAPVAETIVVSAQSPLVDTAQSFTAYEVGDEVPFPLRDAWALAGAAPGVSGRHLGADRPDGGGIASTPQLVTAFTGADQVTWAVDDAPLGDLESIAVPHAALTLGHEELDVRTTDSEGTFGHAGVHLDLRTPRGGNVMQLELAGRRLVDGAASDGDAAARWSDGERLGASLAGPLRRDRLWGRIYAEADDASRRTVAGQATGERLESRGGTLDAASDATTLRATLRRGERRVHGLGAGPSRDAAATLGLAAQADSWTLEATHVAGNNLFLTAAHHRTRGDGAARSAGAPDGQARWTRLGRLEGGALGRTSTREMASSRVEGSYFFDAWSSSHTFEFGAARNDLDDVTTTAWPGSGELHVAGRQLAAGSGVGFVVRPAGPSEATRSLRSLWAEDEVELGRLRVGLGLRWDEQRGSSEDGALVGAGTGVGRGGASRLRWRTLSPRLALARVFGDREHCVFRASWSRFADRLSRSVVDATLPGTFGGWLGLASSAEIRRFRDTNGDGLRQAGEPAEPWHALPLRQLGPGPEAPRTEEWRASIDFAPRTSLAFRLAGHHRERRGMLEVRDLVFGESGLRPARRSDYLFDHGVSGTMPDGTAYEIPVYSLDPALGVAARTLAPNGHDLEASGVTFEARRRWVDAWALRVALHYAGSRWRARGTAPDRDPTPRLGVARDGDPFLAPPGHPQPAGGSGWLGDGWSAEITAGVHLFESRPWGTDVELAVHARQGDRLPWSAWDATSADGRPRLLRLADPDRDRLDDLITADLRLAKEVEHGNLTTAWTLDVLNLLDDRTVIHRQLNLASAGAAEVEDTTSARALRFGVRLRWR